MQNEIEEILKKHNKSLSYEMDFPVYRILPEEVLLAIKVLEKHGMRIKITFKDIKTDK